MLGLESTKRIIEIGRGPDGCKNPNTFCHTCHRLLRKWHRVRLAYFGGTSWGRRKSTCRSIVPTDIARYLAVTMLGGAQFAVAMNTSKRDDKPKASLGRHRRPVRNYGRQEVAQWGWWSRFATTHSQRFVKGVGYIFSPLLFSTMTIQLLENAPCSVRCRHPSEKHKSVSFSNGS